MTKLNEIEKLVPSLRRAGPGFVGWADDVDLLIRAVRQLGDFWLGHFNAVGMPLDLAAGRFGIDPDVLELIDETD